MSLKPLVYYFLFLILLDVAVKSQMSSNSNSHAFLQGDNDMRYIVDSIPITVHKDFTNSNSGVKVKNEEESTNFNSKMHLKFEPSLLDFKQRPLGVPHHEKVTIINLNCNKTVHMASISGNTVHFHSSFFEDKVIPPLGNTSFNVVFLGREEGEIESNLYIHSSEGSFKYQVRGSSVQSPYRLRPLSGIRLPLNASFSFLIQMHNPYSTPLQLVEVYSSGGEFHLELPSGELEGPKHLWEIPAFLTKDIIRVRFHARAQKNHTAYIRLKVNNSEEVLVVPLEVEVGANCGLYSTEDIVDFGIGGSQDSPKTVNLRLHNSWKKPIKIQNVISTPVSKALRIEFEPVKVPSESEEPIEVAKLTFDWQAALETGQTSGRIVVKGKQSAQKLVIPYSAMVLAGGLAFDSQVTQFQTDEDHLPPPPLTRTFNLINNFKIPIAVTTVSLSKEAQPYFQVKKFQPIILQPGQASALFEIVATISPLLILDSVVNIVTNVSALSVPLLCYTGKLVTVISHRNEASLELGTIGSGTEKQVLFALVNENPVPVTLLSWESSLPSSAVIVASVQRGNASSFLSYSSAHTASSENSTTKERTIGPGQYMLIRVTVRATSQLGETNAHISLRTEYETISVAAHMRIEHGSLQVTPDPIIFNDCFPGKLCGEVLRVQSLFSLAMAVTGVGGDPRLTFSPAITPILLPTSTTALGILSFNTSHLPLEDNYLATTHNLTGGIRWQDTLELPAHCPDYDLGLLMARHGHYRNLSMGQLNVSLRLDTTEVRDHEFNAVVKLGWPRIAGDVVFPLTQIGNTTHRSLMISNPGTHFPLTVQLVMEAIYPSVVSLVDSLPDRLRPEPLMEAQAAVAGEFTVDTSESAHKVPGSQWSSHRDSWVFSLPPQSNTTVRVGFTPSGAHLLSSLLLIRNTLTVLEVVQLSGTGAYTQFKFGNRKPGSTTPLLFELVEKHFKDCEREKQRKYPAPNLTVKRSFTARNMGSLPISVHGFHISGLPCEGYGFRVLNCESFYLPPNSTRKVDIAFTPDLTLSRVQRTLGVITSIGTAANYTLVATLPTFLLGPCSVVLARPSWEPLLYYCAVTFMVFLLVCVLAAAFLESDRALKCALMAMSRDNATVQPVLDLKSIGTGVGLGISNATPPLPSPPEKPESPSSWTRAPASSPVSSPIMSSTTTADSEGLKDKFSKSDIDGTSGSHSSSSATREKCAKRERETAKKEKEREKTVVSKRYSDPTDSASLERRGSWTNVFTKSLISPSPKPQPKPMAPLTTSPTPAEPNKFPLPIAEVKRKVSKKNSNSGRFREMPVLPAASNSEDTETSSTTTESSHDDNDKEVEVREVLLKTPRQRSKTSDFSKREKSDREALTAARVTVTGSASSLELEWEDEEPAVPPRKAHSTSRSRNKTNKSGKSSDSGVSSGSTGRSKTSGSVSKQSNTRAKEKQPLTTKRSTEKLLSTPKPLVYEPPPPPLGVWDESRASFSDVVARSHLPETTMPSLHSLLSSSTPTASAAVASTPATSAVPAALGPIGSKKVPSYPSLWDCWSDSVDLNTPAPSPAPTPAPHSHSSFFLNAFSDTRPIHSAVPPPVCAPTPSHTLAPTSASILQNTSYDGGWAQPNIFLKMLEEQRRLEAEEFKHRPVYQDAWSPWEPMCSTATAVNSTVPAADPTPPPVPAPSTNPALWGSDVWAPPPPDTWAPPGLAPRAPPPPTIDPQHIGLDYDPFRSLSNIWAPNTPNSFWKPSGNKN